MRIVASAVCNSAHSPAQPPDSACDKWPCACRDALRRREHRRGARAPAQVDVALEPRGAGQRPRRVHAPQARPLAGDRVEALRRVQHGPTVRAAAHEQPRAKPNDGGAAARLRHGRQHPDVATRRNATSGNTGPLLALSGPRESLQRFGTSC